jgi:6-pyruvoyltetrahydropterin/6-carboxytetrahydropterin synthase
MWNVRVSREFSAAHQLHGSGGKCEQVHGHNYRVEVTISSKQLNPPGMVADFVEVREKLDSILPDHRMLNEVYLFNPTAENLARQFFEEMSKLYPVSRVAVWETGGSCAEYSPD